MQLVAHQIFAIYEESSRFQIHLGNNPQFYSFSKLDYCSTTRGPNGSRQAPAAVHGAVLLVRGSFQEDASGVRGSIRRRSSILSYSTTFLRESRNHFIVVMDLSFLATFSR